MSRLSDVKAVTPVWLAMGAFQKASDAHHLEHELVYLVKIRASQMNSCAFCLSMHVRDALKDGERMDRIATLSAWRECEWFTERERAALAWTEALTALAGHHIEDSLYEEVRAVFTEDELVSLTMCIMAINGWNRMNAAFGTQPEPFAFPS